MPKGAGYKTGGVKQPGGISKYENSAGQHLDVTTAGAGMGNSYHSPNNKETAKPGGYGSSGSASNSRPSK